MVFITFMRDTLYTGDSRYYYYYLKCSADRDAVRMMNARVMFDINVMM